MANKQKQSKKDAAKQETRELMIAFLASCGTPKAALVKIREGLSDDSATPTMKGSPDVLIVRHPFTLQRVTVRKALK